MIQVLVSGLTNLINSSNLNSRVKTFLLAYVQQIPTLVNSLTPTQKQQAIQDLQNLIAGVKAAMSANQIPASLGNQLSNIANEAIAVLRFS